MIGIRSNLYQYVHGDPLNLTDPTGQCPPCAVVLFIEVAEFASAAYLGYEEGKDIINGVQQGDYANVALALLGGSRVEAVLDAANGLDLLAHGCYGDAAVQFGFAAGQWFLGGRSGPSNCFAAGTLVQTSTGARAIETLQPGDLVLAEDPEAQQTVLRPVLQVQ